MANLGRFACVALPFLLTLGSLIAMLVAGLAGVADKSLYMFQVNTTNLSISPASVANLLKINVRSPEPQDQFHSPQLLESDSGTKTSNITAADLGLANLYDISIWGYCYTPQNGTRQCTNAKFNWAESTLNITTGNLKSLITLTGKNVTLPNEIGDAVTTFGTAARWTQIVFIIAYVALGIELFFGLFANCSRAFSCVTFLFSLVATIGVGAAAGLATAMSVVVVGAVEASAKFYGVKADFNRRFLAAVWIGAVLALGASLFWLFTICCCKPDRSRSSRSEKGPYQPIGTPAGYPQQYPQPYPQQNYGAPQRGSAYEPYSHTRV